MKRTIANTSQAYHNREDEALQVVASIYSSGDITCPVATAQHWEILNAMRQEQESGKTLSYVEMVRTSNSRKRLILVVSVAVISMLAGNNIVSYYLGDMLTTAGLYNNHVQLQVVSTDLGIFSDQNFHGINLTNI